MTDYSTYRPKNKRVWHRLRYSDDWLLALALVIMGTGFGFWLWALNITGPLR